MNWHLHVGTPSAPTVSPRRASPQHAGSSPSRFARVDVLRAVAAISVVAYHLLGAKLGWHWTWQDNGFAALDPLAPRTYLTGALSVGWAGVPLFFALSGFCIHGAFLRQARFDTGVFLWRRFWRIYPPFLAAIVVFCFWPLKRFEAGVDLDGVAQHITTVFTLTPETFWSLLNPSFWSVAVECQCYLLYPLFLCFRQRWGNTRAALGWFAFGVLGSVAIPAFTGWPDHGINFWSCVSLFSFGGWALGALVAEDIATNRQRAFYQKRFLVLSTVACVLSTLWRPTTTLSFALAAVAGALLIKLYADRRATLTRVESQLARFGVMSYSLYLWHQPLLGELETLGRELSSTLPLNAARVATQLTIALGLLLITFVSYHLFERPGIAMAAQLQPVPSPKPIPAPAG